jgi:pimeloyl-ACP methyl ester carboxylesterase
VVFNTGKFVSSKTVVLLQETDIEVGGPGGVNTDFVTSDGQAVSELLGGQYNIVGIDGRAVGHSGPTVDCWPGHPEQRAQFEKLYYPYVSHASSTALETQFYAADIFGQACTLTVGGSDGNASFISTPAVARDMLSYIQAEQVSSGKPVNEAKLTYWGVSYGTVLGITFASMFPNNVERLIVDGVLDASDYYDLAWKHNLFETDEAIESFSEYCYQGGPQNCSFWGPSATNISDRFDSLLADLKYNPIPIPSSEACDIPLLATYSDLKQYALESLYSPLTGFPILADVLSSLEAGNITEYLAAVTSGSIPADPCNNGSAGSTIDANTLIKCVDGYDGTKYATLEEYRDYVEALTYESEFFGEVWPNNANTVACRSFDVEVPETGKLAGSIMETRNTSFPILFVTADVDPVTPKRKFV